MIRVDRSFSEEEIEEALIFVYDIHRTRPIKKPISIVKKISGRGFIVNEGMIVNMSAKEVAGNFKSSLNSGNRWALELNEFLSRPRE